MGRIDRHITPADHALAFARHRLLEDLLAGGPRQRIRGQKYLPDREAAVRVDLEAESLRLGAKELLR